MPDDLRAQFPKVREVVAALRIPVHELAGYEADDVIGTLTVQAEARGIDTTIVTGDLDMLQIVSDRTSPDDDPQGVENTVYYDPARSRSATAWRRPDGRLQGPEGRLERQHPGSARGGGEDRGEAHRRLRRLDLLYARLDEVRRRSCATCSASTATRSSAAAISRRSSATCPWRSTSRRRASATTTATRSCGSSASTSSARSSTACRRARGRESAGRGGRARRCGGRPASPRRGRRRRPRPASERRLGGARLPVRHRPRARPSESRGGGGRPSHRAAATACSSRSISTPWADRRTGRGDGPAAAPLPLERPRTRSRGGVADPGRIERRPDEAIAGWRMARRALGGRRRARPRRPAAAPGPRAGARARRRGWSRRDARGARRPRTRSAAVEAREYGRRPRGRSRSSSRASPTTSARRRRRSPSTPRSPRTSSTRPCAARRSTTSCRAARARPPAAGRRARRRRRAGLEALGALAVRDPLADALSEEGLDRLYRRSSSR